MEEKAGWYYDEETYLESRKTYSQAYYLILVSERKAGDFMLKFEQYKNIFEAFMMMNSLYLWKKARWYYAEKNSGYYN